MAPGITIATIGVAGIGDRGLGSGLKLAVSSFALFQAIEQADIDLSAPAFLPVDPYGSAQSNRVFAPPERVLREG